MAKIRFRASESRVLFDYPKASALSASADRVVFLSQRDFYLLLNSIEFIGKFRNRVYTGHIDEIYDICSDEQWQTFKGWVEDLENNLGGWPVANEYLERIAIALEAANEAKEHETLDLLDLLEAFGVEPSESEQDILEALQYLFDLPGINLLPDFKIPKLGFIQAYLASRPMSAHLQLMRDISISQRAQAVAQGGVDFAGLYDTMGETADSLLVKAGFLGKAYWLWRWIDNDQIPGWLGWITTISGALLGSIRGATYDVAGAIESLETNQEKLTPVLDAIENVLGGDYEPPEE